ncbi:glycoside hydrolase family 19 protein [uncultured Maritalea sp.]|uniref:glycoside hydrolase family 19 protein n=1 Tax=uncultured Maritalea sp. TaxID=757249 RepID=UPI0026172F64|nr:glycoside hydrolase family 19 protein [uncultured Maritalea sp.]
MSASLILAECKRHGLLRNQAAYVLATAEHETGGTFKPVRETFAKTDAQAKARLETAFKKGQLKWVKTPYWRDGFFGRGFVQLTHKYNYENAGKKLGLDLVRRPSDAMKPNVAAQILVVGMKEGWFTGKKLSDYITLQKSSFKQARRIVNGMDRAAKIAALAVKHDTALKAAGYGKTTSTAPIPPKRPETRSQGIISSLIALLVQLITSIFGAKK